MTSIIKFTPLSGPCYLLQIDQFNCLLDCGWNEATTPDIPEDIIKNLDAVLITYPDPFHLGALPYLVGKCGLTCPIYATRPVNLMGRMFMSDLLLSRLNGEEFDLFTDEHIEKAFDKITNLSYNQCLQLTGKGHGLSIVPLRAGHMLGGTIWKIIKDEEDIIYAVDFNHTKEQHLDRCVLDGVSRPSLLITDASNASYIQKKQSKRDDDIKKTILETLRGGGNILIAADTAGRVLELSLFLDNLWSKPEFSAYSLAMVSNVANKVIDIARSTIEWMSARFIKTFEEKRDSPFRFKHLQLKQNLQDLALLPQPMVVLGTQPDLECGFARDLFTLWCTDEKNCIIFTERSSPGTLAHHVLSKPKQIELEIRQRVELKEEEIARELAMVAVNNNKCQSPDSSEDESDLMADGRMGTGVYFFKQSKRKQYMFPAPVEQRIKFDDYGEIIKPEDFILFTAITDDNNDEQSEEIEEAPHVKPTKCVKINQTLELNAKIYFFDYEGRADGESVKNLISKIRPRRLILVRGTEQESLKLKKLCEANVGDKVFVPQKGVPEDVTTENHIYQVTLSDALMSSIDFVRAYNGVDLAWIDVEAKPSEEKSQLKSVATVELLPSLDALPAEQIPLHNAIFVNELKLSDFKQILMNNNIQAEFSGGVLYCEEKVAIRRRESGKIHLEGTLCPEYFKIRQLLYAQYVIL